MGTLILYVIIIPMLSAVDDIHEGSRYRIKDKEKARIFHAICSENSITRKKVFESLEMRPTTVSKAVSELLEDKIIYEGESINPGKKGRPEIGLFPNYNCFTNIAVYVFSKELRGVLINLGEEIISELIVHVNEDADNHNFLAAMNSMIDQLILSNPAGSKMLGIGVSVSGSVNSRELTWLYTSRWPKLKNLSFKELSRRTGLKVSIQRILDTDLKYILLKKKENRNCGTLLVHWGYGIGSAYANEGNVLTSTLGAFGEIGHWQVNTDNPEPCTCGASGCLETEAALWALLPEIEKSFPGTPEDEDEFEEFYGKHKISGLPVVQKAYKYILNTLINLYYVLYPDQILLYGPFFNNELLFSRLSAGLKARIPEISREPLKISRYKYVQQGAIVGSTYPFFRAELSSFLRAKWDK